MNLFLLALSSVAVARPPAPPRESVRVVVEDVTPAGADHLVFLTNPKHTRVVPVQVRESEAIVVAYRLAGRTPDRPFTHDLLDELALQLDTRVQQVHIHSLDGGTFRARVTFRSKRRLLHLEARASDAIALALGAQAPIYLDRTLYDENGVEVADLLRALSSRDDPEP